MFELAVTVRYYELIFENFQWNYWKEISLLVKTCLNTHYFTHCFIFYPIKVIRSWARGSFKKRNWTENSFFFQNYWPKIGNKSFRWIAQWPSRSCTSLWWLIQWDRWSCKPSRLQIWEQMKHNNMYFSTVFPKNFRFKSTDKRHNFFSRVMFQATLNLFRFVLYIHPP